ncbi:hypothetical protein [Leucobacter sp. G161]|uniref:hypothetical protein n=1 Tax=Leucobacter sp. G161 TaxID=663704 RepID=UPI00073B1AB4|nr:hypothetical protein [Leucobacter sp. G161]KUF05535.1 hypothetical protein AUL38_04055 [Leucobacter sp. G161]
MDASEVVAAVHRRDQLLREATALTQLANEIEASHKVFGYQEVYGTSREKTFRPVAHSQQKRLVGLAREHAGEIRAEADRIMESLESRAR